MEILIFSNKGADVMFEDAGELAEILEKEIDLLRQQLLTVETMRNAAKNNSIKELVKLTAQAENIVYEIKKIEAKRVNLSDDIRVKMGLSEDAPLREVLGELDEACGTNLEERRISIENILIALKLESVASNRLFHNLAEGSSLTIRLLRELLETRSGYENDGKVKLSDDMNRYLNISI